MNGPMGGGGGGGCPPLLRWCMASQCFPAPPPPRGWALCAHPFASPGHRTNAVATHPLDTSFGSDWVPNPLPDDQTLPLTWGQPPAAVPGGGGGCWHKALVVGSVSLWRRLLASRL